MQISIQNHNDAYIVREIVSAYYPKEKLEFIDTCPTAENFIISGYDVIDYSYVYRCTVRINGKIENEYVISHSFNRNCIKKSIALCLENITGLKLPWGVMTGIRPSKNVREFTETHKSLSPVDYLIKTYGCNEDKAKLAYEVYKNERSIIKNKYDDGISLYIGIPFCPTRCLYCSFTSQSIAFSNKLVKPYIKALIHEIHAVSKSEFIKSKRIETVYFGGGTPSAIDADQIDIILTELENSFDLSHLRELTFEAGRPDTITEEKLGVLKKHGITRISINPQTVNDKTLELIGRNHTSEDFFISYQLAEKMGFSHINCDIIAGLPGESVTDFEKTVNLLSKIAPESITVHTMCIKHGSFLDMKYNMYSLSTAETVNNMLDIAYRKANNSGYLPYYMYRQKNMLGNLENVGYCKPGHACLYNIYIMEEVHNIVALGAGGSTKLVDGRRIERVFNVKEVSEYIKRIDEMIKRKTDLFESFKEI